MSKLNGVKKILKDLQKDDNIFRIFQKVMIELHGFFTLYCLLIN